LAQLCRLGQFDPLHEHDVIAEGAL
jgi:hypothetical protein